MLTPAFYFWNPQTTVALNNKCASPKLQFTGSLLVFWFFLTISSTNIDLIYCQTVAFNSSNHIINLKYCPVHTRKAPGRNVIKISWVNWDGDRREELGDGKMRDQEDWLGGGMDGESNGRSTLIEGVIMELERKLILKKFSGIHKDYPS